LNASLCIPVTDYYHTYRPVLYRVLSSLITDPRASLSSVSALTAAVTEFASTRCLDYATSLVAAPPTTPLAVEGESALGCDALEDRQFEPEFLAAASPEACCAMLPAVCAMLLAPEGDPDALDIPTPCTYAEAVSGPWASQWRASMDSEMASYRSTGTYIDEVLQRFELQHSTVQHRPLAVDYRLTGTFPDKPFEPSGPYAELVGCLMETPSSSLDSCCEGGEVPSDDIRLLGGRQAVVLTGHYDSSYADDVEAHMSTQGYCFSLGSGAVSWRSTRSSSVSTSTAEAEIYDGAMAAQELRWLTFLLTDLGERPSSAPTLFIDNKATILLCREP
ncbi:unnamed protein product, partial [Closterium sp. NIES-54]